jgi:hypothetical protein
MKRRTIIKGTGTDAIKESKEIIRPKNNEERIIYNIIVKTYMM